jgi:UDP-N-acetylglucosamine transferase subunit ALG13
LIFVTVGAQMPFDRLVGWVDDWALANDRGDVVAQIGPTGFVPRRLRVLPFLDPPEFRRTMEAADVIVSHAGMGTILTALELGKPILVVPRLGRQGETRNDHQVATADRFAADGLVCVAATPEELALRLRELEAGTGVRARISSRADDALLARIRAFVDGAPGSPR